MLLLTSSALFESTVKGTVTVALVGLFMVTPAVPAVIQAGRVPRLIELLTSSSFSPLKSVPITLNTALTAPGDTAGAAPGGVPCTPMFWNADIVAGAGVTEVIWGGGVSVTFNTNESLNPGNPLIDILSGWLTIDMALSLLPLIVIWWQCGAGTAVTEISSPAGNAGEKRRLAAVIVSVTLVSNIMLPLRAVLVIVITFGGSISNFGRFICMLNVFDTPSRVTVITCGLPSSVLLALVREEVPVTVIVVSLDETVNPPGNTP